ncbi:MAG: DUF4955 domain-containing protein [Bacteroides sp.]
MKIKNNRFYISLLRGCSMLHGLLLLLAGVLVAACYGDGLPLPEKPEPEPTPEPQPEEKPGIDLSACCNIFQAYAAAQEKGTESTLLNYSYAGYEHGERAIPDVDYPEILVDEYGAIPDDNLSDREAFQAAIEAAEALVAGGRAGAVIRFGKGRYDLHPEGADITPFTISCSNIVLRGTKDATGETELYMETPNPSNDNSLWNSNELIMFTYKGAKPDDQLLLTTITGDAPCGSHTLQVSSTSGLSMGQRVLLKLKNDDPELVADEVKPYDVCNEWSELPNDGVQVTEYLTIARIEGTKVTFVEPLMHKVEARWGWTLHRYQHNVGCGVEDITFRGNFQERFSHHLNALHDSGFRMITFRRQVNGWIRRCRFIDVSEGVSVMLSANVSVLDCRIEGNGGHAAIRSQASSHVLIGRCTDEPAQYHSFGVSKTAIGTVIWRNTTGSNSCFESHCSQPRATLLDACRGGFMANHAGGDAALGPNHLGHLTLWNYRETNYGAGKFDLWVRNNRFLMPVIVGYQGNTVFKAEQVTCDESHGKAVYPESLYEGQLMLRLGYLPDWMSANQ